MLVLPGVAGLYWSDADGDCGCTCCCVRTDVTTIVDASKPNALTGRMLAAEANEGGFGIADAPPVRRAAIDQQRVHQHTTQHTDQTGKFKYSSARWAYNLIDAR